MKPDELIVQISSGSMDAAMKSVYVTHEAVELQKPRYIKLIETFKSLFGTDRDVSVMSAPGRTEICGNHTDHNNGKVLAASINLDAIAVVAKNDENTVRVKSEGHSMNIALLGDLAPDESLYGRSTAMVNGVAARISDLGYTIGGYDACTSSDVLGGSGLSSSAAFEVLLGTIMSHLYNDGRIDSVAIAKVAQYSENVFFGKPCGLLDQMASSVGEFVFMDFESTNEPVIEKIEFDFSKSGHSLCIVDTGGDHSGLTADYAAVRSEMRSVAKAMGKNVLREASYEEFFSELPRLKDKVSDRSLLRAIHFYNENKRVERARKYLNKSDFEGFKRVITESGYSSYMYNQNVYSPKSFSEQKISLALAMSGELLGSAGAFRVHGGGFAGTIQAFVPNEILDQYKKSIEGVFGEGSCHVLIIRPIGGCKVL